VITFVTKAIFRPANIGLALVLGLAACAGNKSEIGAQIDEMSGPQPAAGQPVQYVETFPGGTDGCGYPMRDARVWNTHPVRTIKASFVRLMPSGARDFFDVDVPAGEIMTVEQCSAAQPQLIAADYVDRS